MSTDLPFTGFEPRSPVHFNTHSPSLSTSLFSCLPIPVRVSRHLIHDSPFPLSLSKSLSHSSLLLSLSVCAACVSVVVSPEQKDIHIPVPSLTRPILGGPGQRSHSEVDGKTSFPRSFVPDLGSLCRGADRARVGRSHPSAPMARADSDLLLHLQPRALEDYLREVLAQPQPPPEPLRPHWAGVRHKAPHPLPLP